jgi:hypothetical protein
VHVQSQQVPTQYNRQPQVTRQYNRAQQVMRQYNFEHVDEAVQQAAAAWAVRFFSM